MPEEGKDKQPHGTESGQVLLVTHPNVLASCDRCTRHSWSRHQLSSLGLQLSGCQGVKLDQKRLRRCQHSPAPAHGHCCAMGKAAALPSDGLVSVRDRLFPLSALIEMSFPGFSSELSLAVWSCL